MAPDDSDSRDDDGRATRWLRDPYLLVLAVIRRGLRALGAAYERFEEFPGWLRFFSGVAAFLFSVYFGEAVRVALDRFVTTVLTPVLRQFVRFPLHVRVVLLLLVFLSIQSAVTNHRVGNIADTLNIVETQLGEKMDAESEPATDGGQQPPSRDRHSRRVAGALGGAAIGATFGAMLGSSPMIGGLVGGAIIGHEIEKYVLRRRRA